MTTINVTMNGESMEYELKEKKMQKNLTNKHSIVEISKTLKKMKYKDTNAYLPS